MNPQGIRTRIKLLLAFMIAAIAFTFCQPIPIKKPHPTNSAETAGNGTGKPAETPFVASAMCTLTGTSANMNVPAGSPVRITWGWSASTERQVQDHLDAQITKVTLDGKAVTNAVQSAIQPFDQNFAVFWSADVGILQQGRHVITYTTSWKKLIGDGKQTFGPGSETESLSDRCELFVK